MDSKFYVFADARLIFLGIAACEHSRHHQQQLKKNQGILIRFLHSEHGVCVTILIANQGIFLAARIFVNQTSAQEYLGFLEEHISFSHAETTQQ